MSYRDELGAAHDRIRELEGRVQELEGKKKPAPPKGPKKKPTPRKAAGCAVGGLGGFVFFILASITLGSHACVACNSDVTDPALAALKACPAAREALGDDIGWSVVGCSNYRSRSGGDPINEGCHSSQSFQVPVSGTKGRGSYRFSASESPGKPNAFTSGTLVLRDRTIIIRADGTCN